MKADKRMQKAAKTYRQRNKIYGDNYKRHGAVMAALFPGGVVLRTVEDHNRFGVLTMIVSKLGRYAANFEKGGHADSVHDLGVYAFMLEELDS